MRSKSLHKICLCVISGLVLMLLSTVNVKAGTLPTGSYYPDSCGLSHCAHPNKMHFYATGETYWLDAECAEGVGYDHGKITNSYYDGIGVPSFAPGQFVTGFQKGWFYYLDDSQSVGLYKCDGNHDPDSDFAGKKSIEKLLIDYDTFKSEAPSGTVIASDSLDTKLFLELKVHAADIETETNQKMIVKCLVGTDTNVLITDNIYPRRDLSTAENGSLKILTWNNLSKNQAGAVKAVVYNQTDGAYIINGMLDANGTAVFGGFKLRPASTITICR